SRVPLRRCEPVPALPRGGAELPGRSPGRGAGWAAEAHHRVPADPGDSGLRPELGAGPGPAGPGRAQLVDRDLHRPGPARDGAARAVLPALPDAGVRLSAGDHGPVSERGGEMTGIDLRSDTATKPTQAMREAIADAEVGDEQIREDPTVNELERRGAELLGHEDSVFVPTATMANEIALRVLGEPGDELIAEELSHILIAELGGPAGHAGPLTRPLASVAGRFTSDQVRAVARKGDLGHVPTTRIVAIENTHNAAGGRVWPLAEVEAMSETWRELDLGLHLDGARLFTAAVASGVEPAAVARLADTVTICFSKGLGCPLGAIVAGPG